MTTTSLALNDSIRIISCYVSRRQVLGKFGISTKWQQWRSISSSTKLRNSISTNDDEVSSSQTIEKGGSPHLWNSNNHETIHQSGSSDLIDTNILACSSSSSSSIPTTLAADPTTTGINQHIPVHDVPWWDASVYICDLVHLIHDVSGMNYAASIATITIMGRLSLIPVAIWHLRNNPWEPQLVQLEGLYDRAVRGGDVRAQERYNAEIKYLRNQHPNMNRMALPSAGIGLTLFMWIGLRRMGTLYPSDLSTGGMGWFIDLTQPDPMLFLPLLSNILLYSIRELGVDELGRPRNDWLTVTDDSSRLWKYSVRTISVGIFSIWFFLPCSVLCFWIPHAMGSCLQGIVLSQPATIHTLGLGGQYGEQQRRTLQRASDIRHAVTGRRGDYNSKTSGTKIAATKESTSQDTQGSPLIRVRKPNKGNKPGSSRRSR